MSDASVTDCAEILTASRKHMMTTCTPTLISQPGASRNDSLSKNPRPSSCDSSEIIAITGLLLAPEGEPALHDLSVTIVGCKGNYFVYKSYRVAACAAQFAALLQFATRRPT